MRQKFKIPLRRPFGSKKFDWYVDSVNGDDGNTGKKPSEAFQTIAALTSISAGETIGLARGSEWREQLAVVVENVTINAYGPGARPILRCDDVIDSGWTKTGGYTNIYQVTLTTNFTWDWGDPCFCSVWEDGTRLPIAANLAALDSTPGAYYCADSNTTSPVVFVHATGSGNPAANGKTYDMPTRMYGVRGYNHLTVSGIHVKRCMANGGSLKANSYSRFINCLSEDGNKHNVYFGTGSYLNGVIAQRAYFNTTNTLFVLNENSPNNEGCILINCEAHYGDGGFYSHVNTSGSFGVVALVNFVSTNCAVGFTGNDGSYTLINPDIDSTLFAINTYLGFTVIGGTLKGTVSAINFEAGSVSVSCTGTTLRNTANPTYSCIRALNKNSVVLTLVDCTIISDTWVGIHLEGNDQTLTVTGCTFDCLVNLFHDGSQDPVFVMDNNLYKLREGTDDFYAAVGSPCAAYTFAQWQGLGYDLNSSTYT